MYIHSIHMNTSYTYIYVCIYIYMLLNTYFPSIVELSNFFLNSRSSILPPRCVV